jgi:hypothetical protein
MGLDMLCKEKKNLSLGCKIINLQICLWKTVTNRRGPRHGGNLSLRMTKMVAMILDMRWCASFDQEFQVLQGIVNPSNSQSVWGQKGKWAERRVTSREARDADATLCGSNLIPLSNLWPPVGGMVQ